MILTQYIPDYSSLVVCAYRDGHLFGPLVRLRAYGAVTSSYSSGVPPLML